MNTSLCRARVDADQGDQPDAQALDVVEHADDLLGLTGGGEGDHRVLGMDDADVAVDGFGRVQENGGAADRGQGGRDLAPDQPRLAHAGDHDLAAALEQDVDGVGELLVDPVKGF